MNRNKVQIWKNSKLVQEFEIPVQSRINEPVVPMSFALPLEKQIEQFQKTMINYDSEVQPLVMPGPVGIPDEKGEERFSHAYDFLDEAVRQMKDRAAQRDADNGGQAERSMAKTVAAFNALTGHTLSEEEGWEFMILLKLVRGRQGDFRADDYVDAAAYSGLLGECAKKSR